MNQLRHANSRFGQEMGGLSYFDIDGWMKPRNRKSDDSDARIDLVYSTDYDRVYGLPLAISLLLSQRNLLNDKKIDGITLSLGS